MIKAALWYQRRGVSVIPICPEKKIPTCFVEAIPKAKSGITDELEQLVGAMAIGERRHGLW